MRRFLALYFMAIAVAAFAWACADDRQSSLPVLTLDPFGCTYSGQETFADGLLTIGFGKQSQELAYLEFYRLREGRTFDDLVSFWNDPHDPGSPPWATLEATSTAKPASRAEADTLEGDGLAFEESLPAGNYALICVYERHIRLFDEPVPQQFREPVTALTIQD